VVGLRLEGTLVNVENVIHDAVSRQWTNLTEITVVYNVCV